MSIRKYSFEKMSPAELEALAEKFPKAVQTVTTRKPVYSIIAKLLDCGVEVPGVRLTTDVEPSLPNLKEGAPALFDQVKSRREAK